MKIQTVNICGLAYDAKTIGQYLNLMTSLERSSDIEFSNWQYIEDLKYGPCWQTIVRKTICDPETMLSGVVLNILTIRTGNVSVVLDLLNDAYRRFEISGSFAEHEEDTGAVINFDCTDVWYSMKYLEIENGKAEDFLSNEKC